MGGNLTEFRLQEMRGGMAVRQKKRGRHASRSFSYRSAPVPPRVLSPWADLIKVTNLARPPRTEERSALH